MTAKQIVIVDLDAHEAAALELVLLGAPRKLRYHFFGGLG
jgi:hypothetical protein